MLPGVASSPRPSPAPTRSSSALEVALSEPEGWRRHILRDLTAENPDATLLDLAAAVARAALSLEETFATDERDGLAARLHRLAALTALDAWTAARRGWGDARVGRLDLYRRLHGDGPAGG